MSPRARLWYAVRVVAGLVLAVLVAGVVGVVAAVAAPGPGPIPAPSATASSAPTATAQPAPVGPAPRPLPTAPPSSAPPATPAPATPAPGATTAPMPGRPGSGYSGQDPAAGAPPGGLLANMCRKAPDPEVPGRSPLDIIDFGKARGAGTYATYRYAGYGSHLYNPGCKDAAVQALAERMGGSLGLVGQATTEEGGHNKPTNLILDGTLYAIALTVAVVRIGSGQYPVWAVVDQIFDAGRVTFGQAAIAGFLTLGLLATLLWLAARRGMDWPTLGTHLRRVGGVVLLALVILGWNGTIGRQYDGFIDGADRAATAAVSGTDQNLEPADVVGEALMEHVYLPMWGAVHLGWDRDAIRLYAKRLHAASALTVDEAARVEHDPAAAKALDGAKNRDYDAVAAEVAKTHPPAYEKLEGKDASDRPMFAAVLALQVLPIAVVVAFLGFLVFAARLIVRAGVSVYPIAAVALQFPALHRWGIGIPMMILRWAGIGAVATIGSVFALRVLIVSTLTAGQGSVFDRSAALTAVSLTLIAGWVLRDKIAARLGVTGEYRAVTAAVDRMTNKLDELTEGPIRRVKKGSAEFRHGTDALDKHMTTAAASARPEPPAHRMPGEARAASSAKVPAVARRYVAAKAANAVVPGARVVAAARAAVPVGRR